MYPFFGLACGLGRGPCFFRFRVLAPPFFWLFRVGCLGQLSVSGGWDLLMDGAPGCGWDLMGVARVGAKCPCLSFCSSGCACFAFPLGFCFSLHAGATAPATLVGRLVFGGFFFLSPQWCCYQYPSPCLCGGRGTGAPAMGGLWWCLFFDRAGATAPATVVGCFLSAWFFFPLIECPGHWLLPLVYNLRHARPNGLATDLVNMLFMLS